MSRMPGGSTWLSAAYPTTGLWHLPSGATGFLFVCFVSEVFAQGLHSPCHGMAEPCRGLETSRPPHGHKWTLLALLCLMASSRAVPPNRMSRQHCLGWFHCLLLVSCQDLRRQNFRVKVKLDWVTQPSVPGCQPMVWSSRPQAGRPPGDRSSGY